MGARLTVVGAGPAESALVRELLRRGLRPVLLERDRVGETWARQYQGRRLHVLAGGAACLVARDTGAVELMRSSA